MSDTAPNGSQVAALLTRVSNRPWSRATASTSPVISSSSETSPTRAISVEPAGASDTTLSSFVRVRPMITTVAPSAAKRWAVAAPMPDPPPVTMTTLPVNVSPAIGNLQSLVNQAMLFAARLRGWKVRADTFVAACRSLGISVQPARPATPTDKGVVERTFESINTLFCQHVAGYVGSDTTRRGRDVQAAWTMAELADLFHEWVVARWQTRPHDSLRSPFLPGKALSPNEVYAMLVSRTGYLPVCLSGDDYTELLRAARSHTRPAALPAARHAPTCHGRRQAGTGRFGRSTGHTAAPPSGLVNLAQAPPGTVQTRALPTTAHLPLGHLVL